MSQNNRGTHGVSSFMLRSEECSSEKLPLLQVVRACHYMITFDDLVSDVFSIAYFHFLHPFL